MGLIRMGPPQSLIQKIAENKQVAIFIETGTYHGNTAAWAAKLFKRVFTIEKSKKHYEQAVEKYGEVENIDFLLGDSRTQIERIVETLPGAAVFWLDAHWSGGETYGGKDQCPLLEEIEAIQEITSDVYLFIDDARLFLSAPQPPHNAEQWPNISQVIEALRLRSQNDYIVVIEDCIISVPAHSKSMLVEYCQQINQKAWDDYRMSSKSSNFVKGVKLIGKSFKGKMKSIIGAKFQTSS